MADDIRIDPTPRSVSRTIDHAVRMEILDKAGETLVRSMAKDLARRIVEEGDREWLDFFEKTNG